MNHQELLVEPCPERVVDFAEYCPVLEELFERIKRSVRSHRGDWHGYTNEQVFDAVMGEADEYREAYVAEDLHGRHGQINELFDLAVTSIKGVVQLRKIGRVADREVCRQVANDPPDDLPVLEVR
jgi:hypothetical protein